MARAGAPARAFWFEDPGRRAPAEGQAGAPARDPGRRVPHASGRRFASGRGDFVRAAVPRVQVRDPAPPRRTFALARIAV